MTARRQVGRFVEVADGVWQVEGVVTLLRRPDGSWRVRFASTTAQSWTTADAASMASIMGYLGIEENPRPWEVVAELRHAARLIESAINAAT